LPYEYVVNAMHCLQILRKNELHENERPVSLMMLQKAEMNRDRKKQKKPHTMEDFYLYSSQEIDSMPAGKYCAAAMALIRSGSMPNWGLFVYEDLKKNAEGYAPPELLAYICDDVVLLAPEVSELGCKAMIIAQVSASRSTRSLESPCGRKIRVIIPSFTTSFYAEEDVILDVLG
jgi:hypothetical protein